MCPRVWLRMECPECGYPYSEALYSTVKSIPHNPGCYLNCNGGCPVCSPEDHERGCVLLHLLTRGESGCSCRT